MMQRRGYPHPTMAETYRIEIRAGKASPLSYELRPGEPLAPLSVGTQGGWHVEAPGVHSVHLYVYFDGKTLFLQSPPVPDPPTVDGAPIAPEWAPLSPPARISFGRATIVFEAVAEEGGFAESDRTMAQAPPSDMHPDTLPPPPPPRPFKPGAFSAPAEDGDSTRLAPLEEVRALGGDVDATRVEPLDAAGGPLAPHVDIVRPAAGAPWRPQHAVATPSPAPGLARPPGAPPGPFAASPLQWGQPGPGTADAGAPPSGLLNMPPPSFKLPDAPETFGQRAKREWAATSPLRRALYMALPFGLGLAVWLLFSPEPEPPPGRPPPRASASASATPPVASATASAPSPAPVPCAWPPIEPSAVPRPPVPAPSASAQAVGDAGANSDRRERQAADFVAQHAYDQAIRIYDQLAVERPQNPAFREAARILRAKIQTGTP
jgi:hypothetical protein